MAIKEFNRAQIAVAFDVNLTTVDKWRRSGCPAEQQGKNVVFTVRAVSDWLRGRDSASNDALDLSQERAKLTKLQAASWKGYTGARTATRQFDTYGIGNWGVAGANSQLSR